MSFKQSIYSDVLQTLISLKILILCFVVLVPVLSELLPKLFHGDSTSVALYAVWSFLMFYCFQYILLGLDLRFPKKLTVQERQKQREMYRALSKRMMGFIWIFCVVNLASGALMLIGFLGIWGGTFNPNIPLHLLSAVGFFVLCSLVTIILLGTWLPAKAIGQGSGFTKAFGRGFSQFPYLVSRLLICLMPVGIALIVLLICYPMTGMPVTVFGEGWHVNVMGFAFNVVLTGVFSVLYVVTAVVLARAYVRSDFYVEDSAPLSMPYVE